MNLMHVGYCVEGFVGCLSRLVFIFAGVQSLLGGVCTIASQSARSAAVGGSILTLNQLDKRRYKCNECGKDFKRNSQLLRHQKIHTGKKDFQCDLCGKAFSRRYNVTVHRRIHTGDKPFGCEFCGKRFTDSSNLTAHRRKHTGEKPFECEYCRRRFANKSNLRDHRRSHTGKKPYECGFCGKRLVRKRNLMHHQDGCKDAFNKMALVKSSSIGLETSRSPLSGNLQMLSITVGALLLELNQLEHLSRKCLGNILACSSPELPLSDDYLCSSEQASATLLPLSPQNESLDW